MEWLTENWVLVSGIAAGVVAVASAIAAATKNEWDNKIVAVLVKIINVLALNVGNAKNKDAK
jgi:hypothetical protein